LIINEPEGLLWIGSQLRLDFAPLFAKEINYKHIVLVAAEELWICRLEFRNFTRTKLKFPHFTFHDLPPKIIKHAKVRVMMIMAAMFEARIVNEPTKRFKTIFRSLSKFHWFRLASKLAWFFEFLNTKMPKLLIVVRARVWVLHYLF